MYTESHTIAEVQLQCTLAFCVIAEVSLLCIQEPILLQKFHYHVHRNLYYSRSL